MLAQKLEIPGRGVEGVEGRVASVEGAASTKLGRERKQGKCLWAVRRGVGLGDGSPAGRSEVTAGTVEGRLLEQERPGMSGEEGEN